MKNLFNGFIMALTMYTTIPIKTNIWDEKSFKFILPILPIVGGFIGMLWYVFVYTLKFFDIPHLIKTSIFMMIPILTTGLIHIDGFMDTCDAILSRASLQKKREILKDSHVGAFAVVGILILFLFNFVGSYEFLNEGINPTYLIFIPIISRGISAIFALKESLINENGFIANFTKNSTKNNLYFIYITLFLGIVIAYFINAKILIVCLFGIVFGIIIGKYAVKQLDGISGDLCGFIIVLTECFMLVLCSILGG